MKTIFEKQSNKEIQCNSLPKFYHKLKMKQMRKNTEKQSPLGPQSHTLCFLLQIQSKAHQGVSLFWTEAEEQELTDCQPPPGLKFHQTSSKSGQVVQEIKEELEKDFPRLLHPHYTQLLTSAKFQTEDHKCPSPQSPLWLCC